MHPDDTYGGGMLGNHNYTCPERQGFGRCDCNEEPPSTAQYHGNGVKTVVLWDSRRGTHMRCVSCPVWSEVDDDQHDWSRHRCSPPGEMGERGFTLIELMIVLAIILLVSVILPWKAIVLLGIIGVYLTLRKEK